MSTMDEITHLQGLVRQLLQVSAPSRRHIVVLRDTLRRLGELHVQANQWATAARMNAFAARIGERMQ